MMTFAQKMAELDTLIAAVEDKLETVDWNAPGSFKAVSELERERARLIREVRAAEYAYGEATAALEANSLN